MSKRRPDTTLDLLIDRHAPTPQYQQIAAQLQRQIEDGRLPTGTRLPGSRSLAEALGVARVSVITAYKKLEQDKWLESHPRRGLFVRDWRLDSGTLGHSARALTDGDYGDWPGAAAIADHAGRFPDVIQFSLGSLSAEFMPLEPIRAAINRAVARDLSGALGYEPTEGYDPLRRAIAGWVAQLGIAVNSDDVLVTGGCQQAIDLVVQALVPQGGVILTTDPTYIGLIDIARARGITLLTVPYNDGWLDFARLEQIVGEHSPRLFYLMPTFQNPTGAVLPTVARRQLLAWAERYQVPILEDGVYDGLWYGHDPLPPLKALDDHGLVLYASGFSKTVAPGSRIGYLLSDERWRSRLLRIKQAADVCTPSLHQRVMADLISSGMLAIHLEKVRRACQSRRDALLNEWLRVFGETGWGYSSPQGGLYFWATLPQGGPPAELLAARAVDHGVDFALGRDFSPSDGLPTVNSSAIRLNLASHPAPIMIEGLRRLRNAYDDLR